MNYSVRQATLEDLNDIQRLNNELFKNEYNKFDDSLKVGWPYEEDGEEYFKNAISDEYVIVALDEGKIIGYLYGSIHTQGSYITTDMAELNNMLIDENYRGCGIGKLLIQTFLEYCSNNNINDIRVTASFKNESAIKFYMKNGFEEFELTLRKKN